MVSVLVLALAREAVCDDLVTAYEDLFNDRITITVPGYSGGTNKLTDFPLLVKLSEDNPSGFSYSRVDSAGKDIRFLYEYKSGDDLLTNAVPYEVDVWNTNGVSYLWVKLPSLNNNAATKLTMYWAPDDATALPVNVPSSVWNDYAAVFHMNGTIDSSTNSVGATLGAKAASYEGVIGSALGTRATGSNGAVLTTPAGSAVDAITNGSYTITGWLRINSLAAGTPWFYSARTAANTDALGLALGSTGSGANLTLHSDGSHSKTLSKTVELWQWAHVAVVHRGDGDKWHRIYLNGCECPDSFKLLGDDKIGTDGFAFGGLLGSGAAGTLNGELDDIRIRREELSRSWCTNEYVQAVSSSYIAFSGFYSTGKPVYVDDPDDPTPGDDPSPGRSDEVSVDDYAGTATFVPDEWEEGVVLTNFVTLVTVWEGEPAGFNPKTLPFGTEDLRFFDENGEPLDYEIELWDEDNVSYIWVKVPLLTESTRLTMCWGLKEGRTLPANDPLAVWSDYVGVWHMADAHDSTENAAEGSFGPSTELKMDGRIGYAAGAKANGQSGAILDIVANEAIDSLTNEPFTVSGWVYLNSASTAYGALFSRATSEDPAWGAQFCGGLTGDNTKLVMDTGSSQFTNAVTVKARNWVRFDFAYAEDSLTFYIDGDAYGSVGARTILNGSGGKLSVGGFVAAAGEALGVNTLNGYIDEFRLRRGRPSETEIAVESDQCDEFFYVRNPAAWDESAILQNRWRTYPTASKTEWDEGDDPAEFTLGEPWYGEVVLTYQDRGTGETLLEMPTVGGDYRAVFTCPQNGRYSELVYTINFRIRVHRPSHDLGDGNDRILIMNGDESVDSGEIYVQSYSDSVRYPGRPYWVHDVDTGYDYTSTSSYYNFCGGLRHTYYARGTTEDRTRLWDLIDVRYGNTYNNADWVFDQTGAWEEWDEGLSDGMNYLPWNPQGGCLVEDVGLLAEGWHEYAAQAVMCNSLEASINSTLYTNGIGTIYFDCVNSHVDDATNGCYRLVVEIATNAVDRETGVPYGTPTDGNIEATHTEWIADASLPEGGYYTEVVHNPYKFADWKRVEMNVKLVNGRTMSDLDPTNELDLALAGGGSYTNFYRVYVPVECPGTVRFRIRRTAINPDYTFAKDVRSMILVDNVICSKPSACVKIEPRGFYDTTKILRETVGYEGAFNPSYPSVSDDELYARAKATMRRTGAKPADGMISSVLMHYRWRYLDQQATDWLTIDLDPKTLVSVDPISWPGISGDLEYWYEANQAGEYYEYADYSGLGLGLPGYSEEVLSVTNRAETYETDGKDWYTRIRDGKSTYGQIKLFVRRGESAPVEEVEMFVARDRIWRGCMLATNAIEDGVFFRFEGRNRQDDTLEDFQFNTNHWYLTEPAKSLPATGSVVAGTTNDWGCIPCDGATDHLLFQLDESTRALTVVHADWQDFNGWNDAHRSYFTGSSVADGSKSGTSVSQREYLCTADQWEEDCATNSYWIERFKPGSYYGYEFYAPFLKEKSPNGFDVGEGMWVRGAYADWSELSGMALQMAGQGRGYVQLVDPGVQPRGLEAVKFSARIAQKVSPGDFAYCETDSKMTDYAFLTRAAFDLNANSNFTGNASLSLAAFYRPNTSCYEARWEQIAGNIEDGSGTILGPTPRGQRLVLYRWKYSGQEWLATELYAATNSGSVYSWGKTVSPNAIPAAHSITNGLMPFMIGAYNDSTKNETLVIAAVHIPGIATAAENVKGNSVNATLSSLASEKGWLYLVYRDTSADRLKRGTYGTLAANCEGVFMRPQYHPGIVSWDTRANTLKLNSQVYPTGSAAASATFYASASVRECVNDLASDYWVVPNGRMDSFYETTSDNYNGFSASVVTQSVDVYTAPIGTTSWDDEPIARYTLTGFGKPGVLQDAYLPVWSTDDSSVRFQAGGTITNIRTDVVIDNIEISQWRGQDWLGKTETERSQGGPTNFVYTSGWVTDGALQLSPRRTPDGYPCSLRGPLCDGQGTRYAKRGLGLGSFSVWYRNAQPNARLLFQIATNGVSELNLLDRTLDDGTDPTIWTTVTNFDFSVMTPEDRENGVLICSLGLHGVVGVMRVIVDPTLRAEVKDGTDPELFGSVEITQALFRDEPALDKGCWWGFNIRTIGDLDDTEQRMYLPDNPLRSLNPTLEEIGRSFALNNSITDECDPDEVGKVPNPFRDHMPFLQTPTFASNIVGEVSFKARKYSIYKGSQCAEVTLYGTRALDVDRLKDKDWEQLNIFLVSNTTYETYSFKTDPGKAYRAFRFAVTGVSGVTPYPGHDPVCGTEPVRVLLDDVLVSEAVQARLAFRNVGAFRHYISQTTYVPNVPSVSEQPICEEGWGIQAEVYPAMLGEEIDMTTPPRVRLHYYKGATTANWGYSKWKDKATSAWLTAATDTNLVYRSSATDSPAAVIPMSSSTEVVQYMLEVVYTVINAETGGRAPATNYLEAVDWETPAWYSPVDYNLTYGGGSADRFAAFAIIDAIAPGWAWINEINIFGSFNSSFRNSDRQKQFVEVVKPVDYDLNGWTLRMLAAKTYGTSATQLLTNNVAVFGRDVPKQKAGTAKCNYMSFIVVGNPDSSLTGTQYDGAWKFATTDNRVFNAGGELGSYYPVAMQLIRPSGVVEHEVAILGTNAYESVSPVIAWQYSATNHARVVRESQPKSNVFALPDDFVSSANSVGVFTGKGESALCWNNTMKMTPGDLNESQTIDPDFPRPGGELIMVFAYVDSTFGRIRQTVGTGTNTTEMQTITLARGSEKGVDIKYTVDPWCELGTVRETEGTTARIPIVTTNAVRQYTVNVAKGAEQNVTVVASATVDSRLRAFGLDEHNRYTPAVLHWLEGHKDAYGNDFYGWQGGNTNDTIYLAQFLALSGNVERDMTLTEMYWLDMDPTASNMFLRAGMVRPPSQIVVKQPTYDPQSDPKAYTNLRMGVYMSISNGNGHAQHNGSSVWAPYVLRGLGEDETSWNYSPSSASVGAWTSETFKVTGFLNTGLVRESDPDAWIPLRYFVFWENSFDANYESEIDIVDPFSTASPAYAQGWKRWVDEHGSKPPVYISWNLDTRLQPITAEILAPTNRLDGTVTP